MGSQASLTEQLTTLAHLITDKHDYPEVGAWLRKVVCAVHAARAGLALPPRKEEVRTCIKIANDYGLYDAADWLTLRLAGEPKCDDATATPRRGRPSRRAG